MYSTWRRIGCATCHSQRYSAWLLASHQSSCRCKLHFLRWTQFSTNTLALVLLCTFGFPDCSTFQRCTQPENAWPKTFWSREDEILHRGPISCWKVCRSSQLEADKLDNPNVHRLLELTIHTLPAYGHVKRVSDLVFENKHQVLKHNVERDRHPTNNNNQFIGPSVGVCALQQVVHMAILLKHMSSRGLLLDQLLKRL